MARKIKTTDATDGMNLENGRRHYSENGKPLGGIKAVVVNEGGKTIEVETGEVILNRKSMKSSKVITVKGTPKQIASTINQLDGNGVAINDSEAKVLDMYKDGGSIKENRMEENIGTQLTLSDNLSSDKSIGLFSGVSSEPALFEQGGVVAGKTEGNWNEIPVGWKNTSKVDKLSKLEYDPKNKDFNSLFGSFTSTDDLRPVLNGVYFSGNEVGATDMYKLISVPEKTDFSGIYPKSNNKNIFLNSEGKIDGVYPKYKEVIPVKSGVVSFKFDCYKLIQYCNVALNFANKTTRQITLKVDEENVISFNAIFLIETLKASLKLGHEKLYFHFSSPSRAGVFTPNEDYSIEDSLALLLMPVMLHRGESTQTLGAYDIDYKLSLSCYFDFSKNEIMNADGTVADFKMNYGKDNVFTDEIVKVLKSVSPKSSSVPILESFVVVDKKATATDLETFIEIDGINVTNGLYEVRNGAVSVSSYDYDYVDFPKLPEITKTVVEFTVEANYLKWLVDKLSDFTGNDDLRPVMKGINIQKQYNGVFATATDAHKLMTIDITDHIDLKTDDDFNFIVSLGNLSTYLSFVGDESVNVKMGDYRLSGSGNGVYGHVSIESKSSRFISRAIEGKYPNYIPVIPQENKYKLSTDLKELAKLINSSEAKSFKQKNRKESDAIDIIGEQNINGELSVKMYATKRNYKEGDKTIDSLYLGKIHVDINDKHYSTTSECALIMPIMHKSETDFVFAFAYDVFSDFINSLDGQDLELFYGEKNRAYVANESNIIYTAPKGKNPVEKKVEVKEKTSKATLTFPTISSAEKFATEWSRYSKQGHTIGSGTENVKVNIYNVSENDKKWIQDYLININAKEGEGVPKSINDIIESDDLGILDDIKPKEESISDLIEGLKILLETVDGDERKKYEELIDGLELLGDTKLEHGGNVDNTIVITNDEELVDDMKRLNIQKGIESVDPNIEKLARGGEIIFKPITTPL